MYLMLIIYVSLLFTDPDWDGTVTEQTDIHLLILAHVYPERCHIYILIFVLFIINAPFQELMQQLKMK